MLRRVESVIPTVVGSQTRAPSFSTPWVACSTVVPDGEASLADVLEVLLER